MAEADVGAALAQGQGIFEQEVTRWLIQAKFARWICARHPEAATLLPLIDQGDANILKAAKSGGMTSLKQIVRDAEQSLDPLAKLARSYRIHLVGHAHIDMNWMWSWQETVAITLDSFRTVLRLMEEFPQFTFSQSQAGLYRIVEEHEPAMLNAIRQRMREGRWEVTASHWVEGDKNMASGEALCRHVLHTRQFMHKLFGLAPEDVCIDWAPDTFGHPATMPTYLVRAGIAWTYLHRPGVWTDPKPDIFRWRGPDGSTVLALNDMKRGYNGQLRPGVVDQLMDFCGGAGVGNSIADSITDSMFVYGVGDHGGGPTRHDLLWAQEMMTWPLCPTMQFSTASAFFQKMEVHAQNLPLVEGELNTEFTGCFTTQALIKRGNRLGETRLYDAELAASFAKRVTAAPYPHEALREAWRDVLFSHFHDILPGSGVRDTRSYSLGLVQKTLATAAQREAQALRALAQRIDTGGWQNNEVQELLAAAGVASVGGGAGFGSFDGGATFAERGNVSGFHPRVLFNYSSQPRQEVVEITVWDNLVPSTLSQVIKPLRERNFVVLGSDSQVLPHQLVTSGLYHSHDYVTLAVNVDVPALGYARLAVIDRPDFGLKGLSVPYRAPANFKGAHQLGWLHHCSYVGTERSPEGLENDLVRIEIDTQNGGVRRFLDKRNNIEFIAPGRSARLEYGIERPHPMSAWIIEHTGLIEQPQLKKIKRDNDGPLQAALTVTLGIHSSAMELQYKLLVDDPRLYISIKGKWLETGSPETGVPVLRLAIPTTLVNAQATYEIPFGAICRPQNAGEEMPALQWAQISGETSSGRAGLLLLNNGKHGHSLEGDTLGLTLLRSSYDPDPFPELGGFATDLALVPFAGSLSVSQATHDARRFNHTLKVVSTDVHAGDLPKAATFLSVQPAALIISGFKEAEDTRAMILRVYNPTDEPQALSVAPHAALTGQLRGAIELDLMERVLSTNTASVQNGRATCMVPRRAIATLRLEFAEKALV